MDLIQGILVEIEMDAFSMPSIGTTSRHPQKLAMSTERNSALDTLAHISLLVHINGDNAYSPPNTR